MADNERKSKVLSKARLPDRTTVIKRETSTGKIQYVRKGPGISGELFISPSVGKGLEQTTELGGTNVLPDGKDLTQSELQEFGVNVDRETIRNRRIRNKYTEWNNFEGYERRSLPGGDSKSAIRERRVKAFMNNEVIQKEVDNDPLIESSEERRIALESISKQLIKELETANTRSEEKSILREYGFDY